MTNATVTAPGEAMPASDLLSRRAALGSILDAGATLAVPHVAAAASLEADPVFAAIERHKASQAHFVSVLDRTDDFVAELEGRVITDADQAEWQLAADAEERDLLAVFSTAPQTKGGMRALLEYLSKFDLHMEIEAPALTALIDALLCSPVLASV